ncbi:MULTISPECIES: ABC transporter permease [unclassified Streptomyces]|uniref:ABC transporter permease n=1 Tax=unclassified Streptomyces TaxID=2593676 RepID=UPI0036F188CC
MNSGSRSATATGGGLPRALRRLREPLVSASVFVLAILVWEAAVRISGTPDYALPAPSLIASTADWTGVLSAARDTIGSVLWGFVVGNAAGLLLALLISASPLLAAVLYPLALTVRAVPVVALAPFITLVAGRGSAPTVVVAALIVFFPTLVNVLLGLRSVEREALELMHVLNCGTATVYWRVRLPAALPAFFDSLRIAAPSAVLGVMTAEWLIGGDGLGKLVISTALSQDTATMWGAILASSLVAGVVYAAVTLAERRLLPWAVRR